MADARTEIRQTIEAAQKNLDKGRPDLAIKKLRKARREYTRSRVLAFHEGVAQYRARHLEPAIRCFRDAVGLGLRTNEVFTSLGAALAAARRYQEAETAWQDAIELDPADPVALGNLARLRTEQGRRQDALAVYSEALEKMPGEATLLVQRGDLAMQSGDLEAAVADYEAALASDGANPRLLYNLGFARFLQGDQTQATRLYKQMVAADGELASTHAYYCASRLYEHAQAVEQQNERRRLAQAAGLAGLIGTSEALKKLVADIVQVAQSKVDVLLLGESGTGKELVASAIHNESVRKDGPFFDVNCAALPRELVESELFGHEPGAFTGASRRGHTGAFRAAKGGTLFLDEIGDMPLDAQTKILRALEQRVIRPVGGNTNVDVDVRIVASTNQDLRSRVKSREFREDLYYRLSTVVFTVPPLRDRREDVPLLVQHFLQHTQVEEGCPFRQFTPEAIDAMQAYDWPGNVRELRNVVTGAVAMSREVNIDVDDLPAEVASAQKRRRLVEALEASHWNVSKAAETLGVRRETVHRQMKDFGIENPRTSGDDKKG